MTKYPYFLSHYRSLSIYHLSVSLSLSLSSPHEYCSMNSLKLRKAGCHRSRSIVQLQFTILPHGRSVGASLYAESSNCHQLKYN